MTAHDPRNSADAIDHLTEKHYLLSCLCDYCGKHGCKRPKNDASNEVRTAGQKTCRTEEVERRHKARAEAIQSVWT